MEKIPFEKNILFQQETSTSMRDIFSYSRRKFTYLRILSSNNKKYSQLWDIFFLFKKKIYLFEKNILFQQETFTTMGHILPRNGENFLLWEKYST
jgi:hypothetical protein